MSPLMRGRELKHVAVVWETVVVASPLMRGRELKLLDCRENSAERRRPLCGGVS